MPALCWNTISKPIALELRPLTVKAQNPVIGLLKGTLISTASATRSSIWKESIAGHGFQAIEGTHLLELVKFVLAGHVVVASYYHACKKSTQ